MRDLFQIDDTHEQSKSDLNTSKYIKKGTSVPAKIPHRLS